MERDAEHSIAERLLQVIDEGRRTTTYKLALALALIDALAERVDPPGNAPGELHTRDVARHVVRYYLPQVRPYVMAGGHDIRLEQIPTKRATAVNAVFRLHLVAEAQGRTSIDALERHHRAEFEECLDEVEYTFARYPLLRLQVIGATHQPFLYDVDWDEGVTLRALHARGGGQVVFRPGAADELLRLAPLLRPLIELHWTREVARWNGIATEDERLHAHLFGASRVGFPAALRDGLAELQAGRCFYCHQTLARRRDVDHFLPWSRVPNDSIENLVIADRCNAEKSHYLPATAFVDAWAERLEHDAGSLAALAGTAGWASERERSIGLARSTYSHLPEGAALWAGGKDFETLDRARLLHLLAPL